MEMPTHSTSEAPRRRPGFTLVELMVVVAIIGVVVTLAATATFQVIAHQRAANTELTIQKVNDALKAHWQAVVDQAKTEPIPDSILYGDGTMQGLIAMAGGPGDPTSAQRARLIWIKLRLKQQFPMNFMEALNPTPPTIRSKPNVVPFVLLPPAPVFAQSLPPTPLSTIAPSPTIYESSVCLLLAISQARKGIVSFDRDRLASIETADSGANGLKAIADGWGRPLTFYRWPIGTAAHLPVGGDLAASNPNRTASQLIGDPLDPDALLMAPGWNNPTAYAGRGGVWAFEKLFHPVRDVVTKRPVSYYTVPVVASAGLSIGTNLNVYGFMGLPMPMEYQPNVPLPTALLHDPMDMANGKADSQDNIYSFRMRLGARGD